MQQEMKSIDTSPYKFNHATTSFALTKAKTDITENNYKILQIIELGITLKKLAMYLNFLSNLSDKWEQILKWFIANKKRERTYKKLNISRDFLNNERLGMIKYEQQEAGHL